MRGSADMARARGQDDVAHLGAAERAVRVLVAGERAGDRVEGDREADERLGAVGHVAQHARQLEVAAQHARHPPGRDRGGERKLEVDDAPRARRSAGPRSACAPRRRASHGSTSGNSSPWTPASARSVSITTPPPLLWPMMIGRTPSRSCMPREHARERRGRRCRCRSSSRRCSRRRARATGSPSRRGTRRAAPSSRCRANPAASRRAARASAGSMRGRDEVRARAVTRRGPRPRAPTASASAAPSANARRAAASASRRGAAGTGRCRPGRRHRHPRASRAGGAPRCAPSG